MVKVCNKCKTEKELSEFSKDKRNKCGLQFYCKSCRNKYTKDNKEKLKEKAKEYRKSNREYYNEYAKKYRQANKDKIRERRKEYFKEYTRERRKNDSLFKIKCYLTSRTSIAFKNQGYSKNTKTQEMLGVDWEIAKQHIERQFTKGMNWNNQGEWHIDHIIPLASASTLERLKELCHYTNLQPMWAIDNLIKSDKIIGQQTILRI